MVDIYSTPVLIATIEQLPEPPSGLLDRYFAREATSPGTHIVFDVVTGGRVTAVYCHPDVPAPRVDRVGVTTKSIEPAYTKELHTIRPGQALVRAPGEQQGRPRSAADRLKSILGATLMEAMRGQTRTREVQASEAIRTGMVTLESETYSRQVVDFGRAASLILDPLAGAERWTDDTSDPMAQLRTWQLLVMQRGGVGASDVVMGVTAFAAFVNHPKIKDRFKQTSGAETNTLAQGKKIDQEGLVFMGQLDGFSIFLYVGWYAKPEAPSVELEIWPGHVVAVGSVGLDGIQAYGAIQDIEAIESGQTTGQSGAPNEGRYFPTSWTEKNPSVRHVLVQSAPLCIPTRVNAFSSRQVIDPPQA